MAESGRIRTRRQHFTMVSSELLRDSTLSLKAAGLAAKISMYLGYEGFELYKTYLMQQCKDGRDSFNSAWKELKDRGYLHQTELRDAKTGKISYEYELLDRPEPEEKKTAEPVEETTDSAGDGFSVPGGTGDGFSSDGFTGDGKPVSITIPDKTIPDKTNTHVKTDVASAPEEPKDKPSGRAVALAVAEDYNQTCASLPRCIKLTPKRQQAAERLHRDFGAEKVHQVFQLAEESDFLTGRRGITGEHAGFKAGFDWLLNPNNAVKVLEGNYGNKANTAVKAARTAYKGW